MNTIAHVNRLLALNLTDDRAHALSQLLVALGRMTDVRCPDQTDALGNFADIWEGGQRTRVFSVSLVQAISEAVAEVPDTLTEFLAAVGNVPHLAREMKAAETAFGQCASDLEVFDRYRLGGAGRNYARRLLRAIDTALPTLCEANGKMLGDPAIMVAVAEIAKSRYPASVNGAGLRPIES